MFVLFNDDQADSYLQEIMELVAIFGSKSQEEAFEMIKRYWQPGTDPSAAGLFEETPYFWAMSILHHPVIGDNIPHWYLDPRFMPPPEWIINKYYKYS